MTLINKNLSSRLKHKVLLQEAIKTDDDFGGFSIIWADICSVYCEIKPMSYLRHSQGEEYENDQLITKDYYQVITRFNPVINNTMRLQYKDKIYEIKRCINYGEANSILILNTERREIL